MRRIEAVGVAEHTETSAASRGGPGLQEAEDAEPGVASISGRGQPKGREQRFLLLIEGARGVVGEASGPINDLGSDVNKSRTKHQAACAFVCGRRKADNMRAGWIID
ncbi:unnamed protein product [Mesocestoides corti]|uniref:Uncharacterized protein n=1 Tax=Mesocestoides corti TaxID=53468 RepID=A0A0R3UCX9_MESCO|nr:unnamed protein product [Mesocestoides corti]